MLNLLEKALKEWTGRSQDHLVCSHLVTIITNQSHISEVDVISQTLKRRTDLFLEVEVEVEGEASLTLQSCFNHLF